MLRTYGWTTLEASGKSTFWLKVGTWLSLVERCVRDAEVAGSNPVVPTNNFKELDDNWPTAAEDKQEQGWNQLVV